METAYYSEFSLRREALRKQWNGTGLDWERFLLDAETLYSERMPVYKIETENFIYEINNWLRKDYKYNVYVQKTSKLSGTYMGESSYSIGVEIPILNLERLDVTILTYEIY